MINEEVDEKTAEDFWAEYENKTESYTFTCPNCGTLCKGEWIRFDSLGNLHGGMGCPICNIRLIVQTMYLTEKCLVYAAKKKDFFPKILQNPNYCGKI